MFWTNLGITVKNVPYKTVDSVKSTRMKLTVLSVFRAIIEIFFSSVPNVLVNVINVSRLTSA